MAQVRPATEHLNRLGIVTKDRRSQLLTCVGSYLSNANRWSREVNVLVVNDGGHVPIAGVLKSPQVRVFSLHHRAHFVQRLLHVARVPRQVATFALLPDEPRMPTAGAARNTLMLLMSGHRYIQVDDDTVCSLWRSRKRVSAPHLQADAIPIVRRYFASRAQALQLAKAVSIDFIGMHERPLNITAQHSSRAYSHSRRTDINSEDTQESVRATFAGLIGDCGCDTAYYRVWQDAPVVEDDGYYDVLRTTREMWQFAQTLSFGRPGSGLALSMGCDATSLLPPFLPIDRGEDTVFSALLRVAFPAAYVAHLPVMVLHDGCSESSFPVERLWRDVSRVRFADLALALITIPPMPDVVGDRERLVEVGNRLTRLATMSTRSFCGHITDYLVHRFERLLTLFDAAATRADIPLRQCDLRRQRHIAEAAIDGFRRDSHLNSLASMMSPNWNGRTLQIRVRHLGEAIVAWPRLFEAAAGMDHEWRLAD